MARIGYIRVSTSSQHTDRQDLGQLDKLFEEKVSAKDLDRPELQALLGYIRSGDEVVVWSIDRLARSTKDLLTLVEAITKKGCRLVFLSDRLEFGGTSDDRNELMLTMLGAFATWERRVMLARQRDGIAAIKAKDALLAPSERTYRGRRATIDATKVKEMIARGIGPTQVAKELGITRQSVYRLI